MLDAIQLQDVSRGPVIGAKHADDTRAQPTQDRPGLVLARRHSDGDRDLLQFRQR